jgi:hypothetical protein
MSAAENLVRKPKPRSSRKPVRISRSKFKLSDLLEPFDPEEVSWKPISTGMKNGEPWALMVPYIEARPLMTRLDHVTGPENWKDDYEPVGSGFFGALSIRFNGEWITKKDGADETELSAFKGGMSDAFKRACVKWGLGRYLYDVEPAFADFALVTSKTGGAIPVDIEVAVDPDGKVKIERHYCLPPKLPKWALPLGAIELAEKKKEKEAKARREKFAAVPKNRKMVQDEIIRACNSRGITPVQLNGLAAVRFNVNHVDYLNTDQLEELQRQIEEGKM